MELLLSIIIGFMIIGAIYALHANDLLSALMAAGIVGYSLVICFLLLKAPDLAIVQIVVETITLIYMVAIVLNSSRKELDKGKRRNAFLNISIAVLVAFALVYYFQLAIVNLDVLGEHAPRMAKAYMDGAAEKTGSANLVTGVLFDFRGYDTLGEATILFTAAVGVLTILRIKGRKEKA
ncbi:MAG TPA: hydrogen gas-evolving membrane-bound hydrogenase subunit E [Salinivirga sp.]|nr:MULTISPECIES: hydrogen gas-evolving membrane-bound hydrogenase subunit E [Salinivirga]HKK58784.1 hydrogen gas-evolving membrane-bound hydrogenase subunit E [Salinivirga sp.]